jgi:NRAMP (natural resistance-associated macrophage protein)-like metal ion transporter
VLRRLGPGLLVTAAFIGPGTIVTASRAGASFSYALLWAVSFSTIATVVLQEMAARLGLVTRLGLSEAIRRSFRRRLIRGLSLALVALAITGGNAAYETGNLLGASLGLEILSGVSPRLWAVVLAGTAFALLASGTYKLIQGVLVALVVLMSVVFLATAALVRPPLDELLRGAFVPSIPEGSLLTVIALIGTTVVPYNLFLHASAVQEKWPRERFSSASALAESRFDTAFSVALGGVVTGAILVAATPLFSRGVEASSPAFVAAQLEPLLGRGARTFFGLGLFAAGLTSAITAPLAAAYATCGALGLPPDLRSSAFRGVWAFVIATGLVLALLGGSPTEAIVLAQAANGLLLPFVGLFLLVVVNDSQLMGEFRNRPLSNALGAAVVLTVVGLGVYQIARLF